MSSFELPIISPERIAGWRTKTYRTAPGMRVCSLEEAVRFVNERGFSTFWPVKGVEMPSLWVAAAGNRSVADAHDDPGHVTWDWKDKSLGKKRWYYGRVIKRRNAFISLEMLPYFYALSPNYGEPDEDYMVQYEQGQLRPEAKWVYEALLKEGPLDILALKKAARLSNPESEGRFNRGLDDLQMEFKITPIGIAPVGAWRYAFIYECTHRHFPDLFTQVVQTGIDEPTARRKIALTYLGSTGAVPASEPGRIFGWAASQAQKVIQQLVESGQAVMASHTNQPGEWLVLPELIG